MFIPSALYYTENHLWLRPVGLYDYFIGITDFAQKEIGGINLIELELENNKMKKEMVWGNIYGLNQTFDLIAPLECKVMATNITLDKRASSINSDPYTHWFVRVSVEMTISPSAFLNSEEYIKLIQ